MLEGAKRKFDAGGICCRRQSSITYHDKQSVDRIIFIFQILFSFFKTVKLNLAVN